MYYPEKSIKNAKKLLESQTLDDIVSLRLEPDLATCCCSHCWPFVWQQINELIHPQGPVEHEGQALIRIGSERCVLVQNESGPEFLISVAASVDVNALIDMLIKLISTVCSSLVMERKCSSKIILVKRRFVKKAVAEEILLQMDISGKSSVKHIAAITRVIQKVLSKKV